jgi:hypothetical protein
VGEPLLLAHGVRVAVKRSARLEAEIVNVAFISKIRISRA